MDVITSATNGTRHSQYLEIHESSSPMLGIARSLFGTLSQFSRQKQEFTATSTLHHAIVGALEGKNACVLLYLGDVQELFATSRKTLSCRRCPQDDET